MNSFRVLGVDPGFGRTGLGVVDLKGSRAEPVWYSVVETASDLPFSERLQILRTQLQSAITRFSPEVAGVEKLFFQKNVRTALQVGMARGVILLVLADAGIPIVELTPNEIKQAVAGYGSADKRQVQDMVVRLLHLDHIPKPDDAADALAIALTGGFMHQTRRARSVE